MSELQTELQLLQQLAHVIQISKVGSPNNVYYALTYMLLVSDR